MVERSELLGLSKREMVLLVAGLRTMNCNVNESPVGVLTSTPGKLSNDFFNNLLDMSTVWKADGPNKFMGSDRTTNEEKWVASRVDLILGSNSELRAISEYYAGDDAKMQFILDFISAWCKVMRAGLSI